MKRFLKGFLPILLLVVGYWYFVAKDGDYQVSFISQEPRGVVFQHILEWQEYSREENTTILLNSKESYKDISQSVQMGDSSYIYHWTLEKQTDNTTKVKARITDLNNSWKQRIQVPFTKNAFVKRSIHNVEEVAKALNIKSEQFRVHSIIDTSYSGNYCAYLSVTSSIKSKAATMLSNIAIIMEYIKSNEIELKGDPFLEVTSWDQGKDEIQFNFYFPIAQQDSLPPHPSIQFKNVTAFRGLRATFNGNYRTSHNAWHYLLDYANENNIAIDKLPFEVYKTDPHAGGDPLTWKAHIYLPIQE